MPKNHRNTIVAEQGHADAQYNLGLIYKKGQGVPQNNKLAYVWISLAATYGGNKNAIKNRDILAKSLPPQVLSDSQETVNKKYVEIETRRNK
ncbi:MAG: TPR repeat protein [Desulforhopalus sp.]